MRQFRPAVKHLRIDPVRQGERQRKRSPGAVDERLGVTRQYAVDTAGIADGAQHGDGGVLERPAGDGRWWRKRASRGENARLFRRIMPVGMQGGMTVVMAAAFIMHMAAAARRVMRVAWRAGWRIVCGKKPVFHTGSSHVFCSHAHRAAPFSPLADMGSMGAAVREETLSNSACVAGIMSVLLSSTASAPLS